MFAVEGETSITEGRRRRQKKTGMTSRLRSLLQLVASSFSLSWMFVLDILPAIRASRPMVDLCERGMLSFVWFVIEVMCWVAVAWERPE